MFGESLKRLLNAGFNAGGSPAASQRVECRGRLRQRVVLGDE